MRDWTGSASHYANIVNPEFKKLGVGYTYYDVGYESSHRYYWTQLFGDSLTTSETVDVSTANSQVNTVSKFIQGDDEPNTISNSEYGATIEALGGGDKITNKGALVSINGGNDNDTIDNSGSFATICAGGGNDSIRMTRDAQEVLIQYALGDGNDTVSGLKSTDTVGISGNEFTPAVVGDNLVVAFGSDSITLVDAACSGVQILGARSKFIILTNGDDPLTNTIAGVNIQALDGDDYIDNYAAYHHDRRRRGQRFNLKRRQQRFNRRRQRLRYPS